MLRITKTQDQVLQIGDDREDRRRCIRLLVLAVGLPDIREVERLAGQLIGELKINCAQVTVDVTSNLSRDSQLANIIVSGVCAGASRRGENFGDVFLGNWTKYDGPSPKS